MSGAEPPRNDSWDEVRLHLLASVMSVHLREYLMSSASVPADSTGNFEFKTPKDAALAREMKTLCREAPGLISKQDDSSADSAPRTVSEGIARALSNIHREAALDRAECEKRLAKRHRFLQSMLLFDIIGSVATVEAVMRLSSRPGFSVDIYDVWNDHTRATMQVIDSDTLPESFTVSPRALVMVREIVQPLPEAKSAYFEFTKTGTCNMRLRGTPPARAFWNKYSDQLGGM